MQAPVDARVPRTVQEVLGAQKRDREPAQSGRGTVREDAGRAEQSELAQILQLVFELKNPKKIWRIEVDFERRRQKCSRLEAEQGLREEDQQEQQQAHQNGAFDREKTEKCGQKPNDPKTGQIDQKAQK